MYKCEKEKMFVFLFAVFVSINLPLKSSAFASNSDFIIIEDLSTRNIVEEMLEESKILVRERLEKMVDFAKNAKRTDISSSKRSLLDEKYRQTLSEIDTLSENTLFRYSPILKKDFQPPSNFNFSVRLNYPLTSEGLALPATIKMIKNAEAALPLLKNALEKIDKFYTINKN